MTTQKHNTLCLGNWLPKKKPRRLSKVRRQFLERVRFTDTCWYWTGFIRPNGYGVYCCGGAYIRAHRLAYELLVGPLLLGMEVDHLCHNAEPNCQARDACMHRRCVNPAHLEQVLHRVNGQRAGRVLMNRNPDTYCQRGHEYTRANTRVPPDGRRRCRSCQEEAKHRYLARVKLAAENDQEQKD